VLKALQSESLTVPLVFGSSRGRFAATVSAFTLCAALGAHTIAMPSAEAQEVDNVQTEDVSGHIEQVGQVAREVSAKNEEDQALQDDLAAPEQELVDVQAVAQQVALAGEDARDMLKAQQNNVVSIAQTGYRVDTWDPLVAALISADGAGWVEGVGY